ncbi:hypothetical protein HMPREF1306_03221 [Klebsiella pneumoniae subsp. pneumoniae WGLW2]|nr:hypothetical protein HMPREF1306_03221 [Klebsiella pneumoniae subsp. pneumoniae WGLW2]
MNPRNKIFKKNTTIPIISICNLIYINLLIFSGYLIVSDFFRTAYFVDQDLFLVKSTCQCLSYEFIPLP